MSDKTTAKRDTLAKTVNLVRAALATKDYIPALTHIRFGKGMATAYNDVLAIGVASDLDLDRCVPGDLLSRALSSFGGEEVLFQAGKDGSLALKSGRSTVKVPTLPYTDFPFTWPPADAGLEVPIDSAVVRAIERCLLSVGTNPNHPAQMGVTLDAEDGKAVLYSTDNYTISRCATQTKMKLPGDAPVILPRAFCEQLVGLSRAMPALALVMILDDGTVQVEIGKQATILTRTPVDLVPLDFPRIVNKHVDLDNIKAQLSVIPDAFDGALGRALLVLGGEVIKSTAFKITDTKIEMTSTSAQGDAEDSMGFDNGTDVQEFKADAALLARGAKACALMAFTSKVTVMADADCNFVHIIAHTNA